MRINPLFRLRLRLLVVPVAAIAVLTISPHSTLSQQHEHTNEDSLNHKRDEATTISRERALQAFERFKALGGRWRGSSTKGWTGDSSYQLLARDSVVMGRSEFDGAPGRGMATMIHMDGDRLMLTHYCEAQNQPRLVATAIEDDEHTVIFTFVDGTNMSSREAGHMDKAVYRFEGPDRFRSRWTWYQNGKETWFEDILYTRVSKADR